jgi:hypothetical protein
MLSHEHPVLLHGRDVVAVPLCPHDVTGVAAAEAAAGHHDESGQC